MQKSLSYIKDSGDFRRKIKNVTEIPEGAILVTADVVGGSIPKYTTSTQIENS